ncbi:serine hydrolase-like protein [Drosophila ficusphila]|uniref:serine hydrolase-like protein n=1 Tax=Drosophila ficusphila TaxID=30025 RepID=UPI0007E7D5E9|nr:serine hydrolase-like protein [Drosophila ficusphila]XP_017059074.1 serine hydrolase-like protein [Drosophila ficusphila]
MGTLSLSDFEEVRIPAPWGHISGRWYGNRNERPILAIHGWLDNLGTFDRLIPLLPDYIGVLCIDLPGHGRSSHLQPGMHYSIYDYVFIIPRVMKEYGWTKVSLMGHSLGGIMSFMYASLAPHTVDMVISLDILLPKPLVDPGAALFEAARDMEKHLVEEDRQEQSNLHEPPSYTLSQLTKVLAKGSSNSVTTEFAKHLLHRQVAKSQLYPDRFYFSRDGRVKYYHSIFIEPGLAAEMAKRIRRKPYLIIKGSRSYYVGDCCEEPFSIMRENNPHFEFYEVEGGTHHVHLHAAEECARYIVPFIRHHRPPTLTSWSLAGKEQKLSLNDKRKVQERFFERSKNKRSKL